MLYLNILGGFFSGIIFLGLLHKFTNSTSRRRLMVVLTFLCGLFYILEFMLQPGWHLPFMKPPANPARDNMLSPYVELFGTIILVVGGFAFGLGLFNLAAIHGKAIAHRRSGWINSLAFFIALFAMTLSGLLKDRIPSFADLNKVLFDGLYQPLGASVFSILAFFITTAAFRAFRVRSGEATLMMIAAFIVMMAQVPLGILLTNWLPTTGPVSFLRIEQVGNWLMTVLNMAALRAVGFGIGIGALAMSLRVWLSLERGTYFGKEM